MTSKERFLTALAGGVPDRVPCTPDISNYIPCERTGRPYWDIYFREDPPLWSAYLDAADYFRIEHWIASCVEIPFVYADRRADIRRSCTFDQSRDAMVERTEYATPSGTLSEERLCFRRDPPTHLTRVMKDPIRDWAAFKHLVAVPTGLDGTLIATLRRECAVRNQAFGLVMGYPGFHSWEGHVEGGIQTLSYLYYDDRTILDEWFELQFQAGTAGLALFLAEKPDYVCFGGSGTLTMANPELVERYALPALKKWTAMTKAAGIPSVLHSCGKSRSLVDLLAEGTDLDCINPLEAPPMGDVDLREVKRARGSRMALMGNLHTTDVMLKGSPDGVYRASVEAIEAAAEGGGFILSTGDQCPRDTPEENLFAMLRAAEERGRY